MPSRRRAAPTPAFTCPMCGHVDDRPLEFGAAVPVLCPNAEAHPVIEEGDGFTVHEPVAMHPLPDEVRELLGIDQPQR